MCQNQNLDQNRSVTRAPGLGTDCTACVAMEQDNELSEERHQEVFRVLPGFCGLCYLAASQGAHIALSGSLLKVRVCVSVYVCVYVCVHMDKGLPLLTHYSIPG